MLRFRCLHSPLPLLSSGGRRCVIGGTLGVLSCIPEVDTRTPVFAALFDSFLGSGPDHKGRYDLLVHAAANEPGNQRRKGARRANVSGDSLPEVRVVLEEPGEIRRSENDACIFSTVAIVPVQQKGRKIVPALLPHSTLRTTLNLFSILRRRFAPVSHTRSDYCVFASSTQTTYQKRCPPHVTSCGDKARTGKNGGKSRFCPVLRLLRPVKNCRY